MRVIVVGEGMVELRATSGSWSVGHGGDALNMALHFVRFGRDVAFLTALGTDPFSDEMRRAWIGEGLDPSLILTDPERSPGIYAITVDRTGERGFTYWRGDSAARQLFALAGARHAVDLAAEADLLCLSLVSVAILPPEGREALLDLCRRVRSRGGRVAFDGNYRPTLWQDAAEARSVRDAALACCDFGLPTLDDEVSLGGPSDPQGIVSEWQRRGAGEVVVKLGARGCYVDGGIVRPPRRLDPTDTSGAGDAFDAGFLHARLSGVQSRRAAALGQALAGWVVMRPGAIPALDEEAPYGRSPAKSLIPVAVTEASRCS